MPISKNFLQATSLAVSVLALTGCVTSYDTVDLDKTTKGYHIYCNGMPYASAQDCYNRARSICEDAGYTVLKENDTTFSHTQAAWEMSSRDIIIKCNQPGPQILEVPSEVTTEESR